MENENNAIAPAAIPIEKLQSWLQATGNQVKLSEKEALQFLEIATAFNLNPFKREIYVSKYGNQFALIVGYEVYIKRAERSGRLAGWKVQTEGSITNNDLKAVITIHRNDFREPFEHEVFYSEYVQRKSSGEPNTFWKNKPLTMIKKVAIAQGFRLCFSEELGGIPYTADEMETVEIPHVEIKENQTIESALNCVSSCESVNELVNCWNEHKQFQTAPEFSELMTKRKHEIEGASTFEKFDAEADIYPRVKSRDYEEGAALGIVENAKNQQSIEFIIEGEARPNVLKCAKLTEAKNYR